MNAHAASHLLQLEAQSTSIPALRHVASFCIDKSVPGQDHEGGCTDDSLHLAETGMNFMDICHHQCQLYQCTVFASAYYSCSHLLYRKLPEVLLAI